MNIEQKAATLLYKCYKNNISIRWLVFETANDSDIYYKAFDNSFWSQFNTDEEAYKYINEDLKIWDIIKVPKYSKRSGSAYIYIDKTNILEHIEREPDWKEDNIENLLKEIK